MAIGCYLAQRQRRLSRHCGTRASRGDMRPARRASGEEDASAFQAPDEATPTLSDLVKAVLPVGLALLVMTMMATDAIAHGGGLNSTGCHTNRKTGGYHCHRAHSIPSNRTTYCHVVRGENRCGYARSICGSLVSQFRRSCDIVRTFRQTSSMRIVLRSCNTLKFPGLRATISRTPIWTSSLSSAWTGTCHGAHGMSCVAGNAPVRISQ